MHQIVCVTAFASVAAGEVGGYIEKEVNLSQDGNAWVFGDAEVFGDAKVSGNAKVSGDAKV
ncbi:MAG: polymer-forming cytoskeletal protein, partial [Akkermansia sp.]